MRSTKILPWFVGGLLLTWAAFAPALGQDSVPLDVRGDVVQVIRSQPFSVHAGVEAVTYNWTVSATFKTSGQDTADLIVESAPEGTHTIKVAVLIVDFEAKKVLKKSGEITVIVGVKPPDPTPPVPEFTVDTKQGTEWQNALLDSANSLRYLLNDMDMDFPVDDWLYGISRVREKLHHLENTILHIEGFNGSTLSLTPTQFPYREDDFWLGMQFPPKKPGTEEPFTIDEDKLLYTSLYTETFHPARSQCGLLLDEWTEVVPARQETIGMTFHYDQPNSEPPQVLLLVTPSNFRKLWQWDDLVNTLHETPA